MTLKGDAKFKRKLTCGLKNDIRNLVNFHGGNQKCKFLRLLSAQVKIRQIPYVHFETTGQFLFRFFIILQWYYTKLPL